MRRGLVIGGGLGAVALPMVVLVAALAVGAGSCAPTGGGLAADAPVPAAARPWVAEAAAACPALPEAWVAAVMAQESAFRPDAWVDDVNGGTWGLFQLNGSIWQGAYEHPWSADLDGNGVWDVKQGEIHARVAGEYLCRRLDGVRQTRAAHPGWASSAIPELDALIIAHNAGESRLRSYPAIPAVTVRFIANVNERAAAWSPGGATTACVAPSVAPQPTRATGDDGSPNDVDTAVAAALSYVGAATGWAGLCDRLACRAYGYANSGYPTAATHWRAMLREGLAHPGDRCAPLGSFVFYDTGRPAGHVSIVVKASAICDLDATLVTSNGTYDHLTGYSGGVYLTTAGNLAGWATRAGGGYLGWSAPICAGAVAVSSPEPRRHSP